LAKEPRATRRRISRAMPESRRTTLGQLLRDRAVKEAFCVVTVTMAALSLVALYGGSGPDNPIGPVGRYVAAALTMLFGRAPSYPLLVVLFALAVAVLIRRPVRLLWLKVLSCFAFAVLLGTLSALLDPGSAMRQAYFGRKLASFLLVNFGGLGAFLLAFALLIASGMLVSGVGLGQVVGLAVRRRPRQVADARPGAISAAEGEEATGRSVSVFQQFGPVRRPERRVAREGGGSRRERAYKGGGYRLPGEELLDRPEPGFRPEREASLLKKAEIIVEKFADHGIEGKIVSILPGPIITRFEFRPARGIKLSRIISLADDLALAMRAAFVPRIAPIPGKSVVGIEVANEVGRVIRLREILESPQFLENRSKTRIGLGTDIAGQPFVVSLSQITHLLIAGATGSGKSVCINCILCSLLYSATPDELELILIDPKMLELSLYNGLPHLREPVITEVGAAELAFRWAVSEMEHRYQLLAERRVRGIEEYNRVIADERASRSIGFDDGEAPPDLRFMPYLVIVVDELADLMLSSRHAIELPIIRLAAKARAAGIHLVLATQRPSVDVVTGLIKTNFPSRIAFRVAQKVDSRTILDSNGAERLLGRGDMLFLTPGAPGLIRLHGAYVSEREIDRIVGFLKEQPAPPREGSIFDELGAEKSVDLAGLDDPHYRRAVEIVVRSKYASISLLQRKLQIGHSRAARYIDMMEQQGIVGPFRGSKPREVLVDSADVQL